MRIGVVGILLDVDRAAVANRVQAFVGVRVTGEDDVDAVLLEQRHEVTLHSAVVALVGAGDAGMVEVREDPLGVLVCSEILLEPAHLVAHVVDLAVARVEGNEVRVGEVERVVVLVPGEIPLALPVGSRVALPIVVAQRWPDGNVDEQLAPRLHETFVVVLGTPPLVDDVAAENPQLGPLRGAPNRGSCDGLLAAPVADVAGDEEIEAAIPGAAVGREVQAGSVGENRVSGANAIAIRRPRL